MVILLIACFVLGFLLFSYSRGIIKKLTLEELVHTQQILDVEFRNYLRDIQKDVAYLSESPFLQRAMERNWPEEDLEILGKEYLTFLKKKPNYNQVRLIAEWEKGREVVRADRVNDTLRLVPQNKMQYKGNRDYYLESSQLNAGEIYFSKIDLNKEFGKISQPHMPTLRAAVPIYRDSSFQGIIIINADLRDFFKQLSSYPAAPYDLFILNEDGFYLMHPDTTKSFGFEYGRSPDGYHFIDQWNRHNDAEERFPLVQYEDVELCLTQWEYPRPDYNIITVLSVGEDKLFAPVAEWHRVSFGLMFLIVLLFGGLGLLLMRRQSLQLDRITQSMTQWDEKGTIDELPTKRNDEIGRLAATFSKLSQSVRQSLDALKVERNKAIQANQAKEEFLENMSHEIRNPLQSIIGMHRVLESNHPREDQKPVLRSLKFSAEQLKSLVNDVLDFSLLREGKIELNPEEGNLIELLNQIVQSYKYDASVKSIDINLKTRGLEETPLKIDSLRLTQVFGNLISNAIKFNQQGGKVDVVVNLLEETSDDVTIVCEVTDNGVGMSETEVAQLENRFERATDDELRKEIPGTGLGMPIVINILKLFGSALSVSSIPDQGTTFWFELTLGKTGEVLTIPTESQSFSEWLSIRHVLCIDDDPQILMFLEHLFSNKRFHLTLISQISELESTLTSNERFDLIVCDVNLETNSTLDLSQALTSRLSAHGVILFMSGQDLDASILPERSAFLMKPVHGKELVSKWLQELEEELFNQLSFLQLEEDYDYDQAKIKRAMTLLTEQWRDLRQRLLKAMESTDLHLMHATYHKMTTTFKRLGLSALDSIVNRIFEGMIAGNSVREQEIKLVRDILDRVTASIDHMLARGAD